MAGESPDKSVDEGAPGAAESSAERDPRLSVFRPRDPESGGAAAAAGAGAGVDVDVQTDADADTEVEAEAEAEAEAEVEAESGSASESASGAGGRDPLRDAVAAWVASADADDTDAGDSDGDAATGEAEDSASADGAAGAAEPEADGVDTPDARTEATDSDAGSDPAPASDSASDAAADSSDAPAPAVEAKPPVEEPKAEAPADSERTAVFRAFTPVKAKPAAEKPKVEEDEKADQPADSERTAVFRAFKSDSASPPAAERPKPAAEKPKVDEPADSERTAVFRAVKSGSASAPAAEAKPAAGAAEKPVDSERTAVFRVPKVDAAEAKAEAPKQAPAKPLTLAKPNEARAVVKPAEPKPAADPAEAEPAEAKPAAEAPKGSTFVPLRPEGITPTPAAGQRPKAPVPPAAARFDHSERTTQQPLPPKPPLDMLADLTNNPPPPPSPMRTAIRRVKIYAPLVVLLAVILAVVQLVRPLPEPTLVMTAKSSYTFEGAKPQLPWPTEGQAYMAAAGLGTLGQSGEQKPVPIASVTKSMTAYIILRDHPIKKGDQGAMIDVDQTAETEGKKNNSTDNESTLDTVKAGDKISEYDAIAALMIPSANNIARLLARWDSGSQEAFVKKMNDTAKELGMKNTTYTDPSGLDATTVSTAEDQVKLGLKLVEIETLLDITKKPKWVDPSGKEWRNWNGLVPYNDSLGIKTGTTTKAGGNLLFAAQKKVGNTNQLIVGAVLGQHKPPIIDSVLAASKQLMLATQKSLDGATVVKKGDVVGYVDDGLGGRTPVVATADVQAVGWSGLTVEVKLANGGGTLPQTAAAGTEVGLLTVGEGASQVKVPVALKTDLAAPGIGSKLTRVG
ncbi:D-alanyl-D-alanine carboxypeptidase family protein [Streptomyces sp. CLCI03]